MSNTPNALTKPMNFFELFVCESDVLKAEYDMANDHERRKIMHRWLVSMEDTSLLSDLQIGNIIRKLFVDSEDNERIYVPCIDESATIYAGVVAELERLRREYDPQRDMVGFPYKIGSVVISCEVTNHGGYMSSAAV